MRVAGTRVSHAPHPQRWQERETPPCHSDPREQTTGRREFSYTFMTKTCAWSTSRETGSTIWMTTCFRYGIVAVEPYTLGLRPRARTGLSGTRTPWSGSKRGSSGISNSMGTRSMFQDTRGRWNAHALRSLSGNSIYEMVDLRCCRLWATEEKMETKSLLPTGKSTAARFSLWQFPSRLDYKKNLETINEGYFQ